MIDAIGRFALMCSGANLRLLAQEECETERTRYKMIGIFVFLTAMFATLSGGYALYIGFGSFLPAAFVGVLWGVFVFNLDRFIISTIHKREIDPDLSTFETLHQRSGEILPGLLRLIFAVFISIVISTPLELKYFDSEIQAQMSETTFDAEKEIERTLAEDFPEITKLESENTRLEKDLSDQKARCDQKSDQSILEAEGKGGTWKFGPGPVFREKKSEYAKCKTELAEMRKENQARIDENRESLKALMPQRDAKAEALKRAKAKANGLLARLAALHKISSEPNSGVGWAGFFITALFILLETTPIFMKLISKRGPYDDALDAKEYEAHMRQKKAVSDLNQKINQELAFEAMKASAILSAQQQLTQEFSAEIDDLVADQITKAKEEVAKEVISDWKRKHLSRISILSAQPQMTK
jgi:hypothetical protein